MRIGTKPGENPHRLLQGCQPAPESRARERLAFSATSSGPERRLTAAANTSRASFLRSALRPQRKSGRRSDNGSCRDEATNQLLILSGCLIQRLEVGCSTMDATIAPSFTTSLLPWITCWSGGPAGNTRGSDIIAPVGSNGFVGSPSACQSFGLTGNSEPASKLPEWELDELRSSRPVLGARGGEIPPRDSPSALQAGSHF